MSSIRTWVGHEPNIAEMLSDPVVTAVMKADRVNPDELAAALGIRVRRNLVARRLAAQKHQGVGQ